MIRKLRKVGNSNALILDKTLMELIGLEEGGEVEVQVSGQTLTVRSPQAPEEEQIDKHLSDIVRERRNVLRRLAE